MLRLLMPALAAAVLAGCAASPPSRPSASGAAAGSDPRAAAASASVPGAAAVGIAAEQRYMQSLFAGTPVVVDGDPDGSLRVEVPLGYAFDDASPRPKPPLRAVLDRLALSMFRQPRTQLHLGLPPHPAARERLAALRSHFTQKGLAAGRFPATAPRQADMVLLRLALAPGGVQQLDDATLPASAPAPAVLPPPRAVAPAKALVPVVKPPAGR